MTFLSAYGFWLGLLSSGTKFLTLSLGTGSKGIVPLGWQKKAIEYRGAELVSPCTLLA
ncbi:uncharacterized protein TrAtP1_011526 [Trichoderma atroviride]|uniref:uncharacterized protein n=1 Tax=Hypocrea atroviridis TaxID=63577 RepID=UPI0033338C2F|nr:hypothetical protein TrAtP1_011526 [Trichoderma atroviride]